MNENITKELVEQYEEIRKSGRYNMFMEGKQVMEELGMTDAHDYLDLLKDYQKYCEKFGVKIG